MKLIVFNVSFLLSKNTVLMQTGSEHFTRFGPGQKRSASHRYREELERHVLADARVFIEPKAMMFVLGSTCAPFRPPPPPA